MRFARAALLLTALFTPLAALAQSSMTTITATSVDVGAVPVNGTLCFQAVNGSGTPISVTSSGGTVYLSQPFCQVLTAGALAGSLSVPNACTDSAAGHPYDAAVYVGPTVPGPGGVGVTAPSGTTTSEVATDLGLIYGVCGGSWSLDSYVPPSTAPVASPLVGYGSSVPGSCTSPSIWTTPSRSLYTCALGTYGLISGGGGGGGGGSFAGVFTDTSTSAEFTLVSTSGTMILGSGGSSGVAGVVLIDTATSTDYTISVASGQIVVAAGGSSGVASLSFTDTVSGTHTLAITNGQIVIT
jgi:hypothetical protein